MDDDDDDDDDDDAHSSGLKTFYGGFERSLLPISCDLCCISAGDRDLHMHAGREGREDREGRDLITTLAPKRLPKSMILGFG